MKTLIGIISFALIITGCAESRGVDKQQSADDTAPENSSEKAGEHKAVWLTDFEAAKKEAAERQIPLLVNFSGSDWCGWCIRLEKEVFDKQEFIEYASENLVLFKADFPRSKELPEKTREQNAGLARKYGVQGFPTILLLDSEGKAIGKTGYRRGGPSKYVEHLKEMLAE